MTVEINGKKIKGLNSIKIDPEEMEKLQLSEDQYREFRKLMDFTPVKNLPENLAQFYLEQTGFKITSLKVDLEWASEVFADFVKERKTEE